VRLGSDLAALYHWPHPHPSAWLRVSIPGSSDAREQSSGCASLRNGDALRSGSVLRIVVSLGRLVGVRVGCHAFDPRAALYRCGMFNIEIRRPDAAFRSSRGLPTVFRVRRDGMSADTVAVTPPDGKNKDRGPHSRLHGLVEIYAYVEIAATNKVAAAVSLVSRPFHAPPYGPARRT
jgi:hypothetical protein